MVHIACDSVADIARGKLLFYALKLFFIRLAFQLCRHIFVDNFLQMTFEYKCVGQFLTYRKHLRKMAVAKAFFIGFYSNVWLHHSIACNELYILFFKHIFHSANWATVLWHKNIVYRYSTNCFFHCNSPYTVYN